MNAFWCYPLLIGLNGAWCYYFSFKLEIYYLLYNRIETWAESLSKDKTVLVCYRLFYRQTLFLRPNQFILSGQIHAHIPTHTVTESLLCRSFLCFCDTLVLRSEAHLNVTRFWTNSRKKSHCNPKKITDLWSISVKTADCFRLSRSPSVFTCRIKVE